MINNRLLKKCVCQRRQTSNSIQVITEIWHSAHIRLIFSLSTIMHQTFFSISAVTHWRSSELSSGNTNKLIFSHTIWIILGRSFPKCIRIKLVKWCYSWGLFVLIVEGRKMAETNAYTWECHMNLNILFHCLLSHSISSFIFHNFNC